MLRFVYLISILSFFFTPSYLLTQSNEIRQKQLENIHLMILQEEENLQKLENIRQDTLDEVFLRQSEINTLQDNIRSLRQKQKSLENELNKCRQNLENLSLSRNSLVQNLESEIIKIIDIKISNKINRNSVPELTYHEIILKEILVHLHLIENQETQYLSTEKEQLEMINNLRRQQNQKETQDKNNRKLLVGLQYSLSDIESEEQTKRQFIVNLAEHSQKLEALIKNFNDTDSETDFFSYMFSAPKLDWPAKGKVYRNFGEYTDEKYNITIMNNGIDIILVENSVVKSVDEGIVVFAEWFGNSGKTIIIDHKNGYFSLYSNNSRLLASRGDLVSMNQPIAIAGFSNDITDFPLLHFELRRHSTPVDPLLYLK